MGETAGAAAEISYTVELLAAEDGERVCGLKADIIEPFRAARGTACISKLQECWCRKNSVCAELQMFLYAGRN